MEIPLTNFNLQPPAPVVRRPRWNRHRWARAATARALPAVLLPAALAAACVLLASLARGYINSVAANGDNYVYALIAGAIRAGRLAEIGTVKQFWGLPYAMVLTGLTLRVDAYQAIAIISVVSMLLTVGLASVIWSRRVASFFVVTNYTFLQFGVFGGAEGLFLALLFLSFFLARRGNWAWAAVAAAAATTVRPLGGLALLAYVTCLLGKRHYKSAIAVAACGLVILVLYGFPIYTQLGDPLANFHGYQSTDWHNQWPLGFPFAAIIENFRTRQNIAGSTMLGAKAAYVAAHVLLMAGAVAIRARRKRLFLRPQEGLFVCLYSAFMLLYNAPDWALSIYPRLLLPISPLLLDVFRCRLPRSRALLAALAVLVVLFACGTNLGLGALLTVSGLTKLFRP
jgi:hypothetical protein